MNANPEAKQAEELIKSVFQFDSFRSELQKQATETVLKGEHCRLGSSVTRRSLAPQHLASFCDKIR